MMRVMQRRVLWVGAVLIVILILLRGVATRQLYSFRQRSSEERSALEAAELERRIAQQRVTANTANGAKGDGRRVTVVSAHFSGVVSRIFVNAGSEVTAGDPLVQFDDQEAHVKLESASAQLETAKELCDCAWVNSRQHPRR